MPEIIKYFVALEGAPKFEIDAETEDDAREYIKKNFRGSGDVRLFIHRYRLLTVTPYIIQS